MRSISSLAGPIVLGTLLATTPQVALGQGLGVTVRADVRPGTVIRSSELAGFLVSNLTIGETEKNLENPNVTRGAAARGWRVALRVELISREEGVVATYESHAVQIEPGKRYDAATWITQPGALDERLFAPLKPAEFVIFRIGQWTIDDPTDKRIPRECRDATYAVLITPVSDRRFTGASGTGKTMLGLCLNGGP